MASKLGAVLEIEVAESYIKRPADPMVTVEVQDISKLAGFIRIPPMAEGAATTNKTRQITFMLVFQTSVGNAASSAITPELATQI
ncbi:unnamed protein product [Sphagnum balticum]|jgi:hypothetical protein